MRLVNFKTQLMADRLGVPANLIPGAAAELVKGIRDMDSRGNSRLSAAPILPPDTQPSIGTVDAWNPDGSVTSLSLSTLEQ